MINLIETNEQDFPNVVQESSFTWILCACGEEFRSWDAWEQHLQERGHDDDHRNT